MQQTGVILSDEQMSVVNAIGDWLRDHDAPQHLTFGGLAGTGKTTVIGQLEELLGISGAIYCAPTGKAARVLQGKLRSAGLVYDEVGFVKTIHQLIYSATEWHCSECPKGANEDLRCHADSKSDCGCRVEFNLKLNQEQKTAPLVIVDEASMVNEKLFTDLMRNVGFTKVLFVGDHGQLPPVEGAFNLMDDPDIKLETIHRQAAGSPIIALAMQARTTGYIPYGDFGPGVKKVRRADARGFKWTDDTLFLCRTNKTRVYWNQSIRQFLGYTGDPKPGEKVICLKNDWRAGVYNGLTGTIVECTRLSPLSMHAVIQCDDGSTYRGLVSSDQFGHPNTLLDDAGAALWDFGYCLTCHKSQGSQAKSVVVFPEWAPYVDAEQFKRWLYTAITRAEEELLVIQ